MADAPTETSTLVVARPAQTGTQTAAAQAPAQPPPPPPQAILESRIAAMSRPAAPPAVDLSVDFAPWAMGGAGSAGVIAARPVVPPPSFLVQIDTAKTDDLRKVIAALTGQSKKKFTIASLIGEPPSASILSTLSVRRVATANVAFSKRAQQLTSNRDEPALCLLRLEREERLLEARLRIRQSRPAAATPFTTLELMATVPTAIADDLQAFEELRAALAGVWR